MKIGMLIAGLALPVISVAQQAYTLKGQVGQVEPGAKAYLDRRVNGETFLDSALIKDGRFEFKGTLQSPYLAMLVVDHKGNRVCQSGDGWGPSPALSRQYHVYDYR